MIWFGLFADVPQKRTLGLDGLNKISLHRKNTIFFGNYNLLKLGLDGLNKISLHRKNTIFFGNYNLLKLYNGLIYTMDHPDFIVCNFIEFSIGLKRVKFLDLLQS